MKKFSNKGSDKKMFDAVRSITTHKIERNLDIKMQIKNEVEGALTSKGIKFKREVNCLKIY